METRLRISLHSDPRQTEVNNSMGYVIYRSTEEDGTYTALKTITLATATEYSNIVFPMERLIITKYGHLSRSMVR